MKLWIPVLFASLAFASTAVAQDALFVKGTTMHYRATLDEENCMGLDDPSWTCDEAGCCKRKTTYPIQCKVTAAAEFGRDAIAWVTCSEDRKNDFELHYPATGIWFRNKHGLYHFVDVDAFKNAAASGLKAEDVFIPAGITQDIEKQECNPKFPEVCSEIKIQAAQSAWCRTDTMTGGDGVVQHVCIDKNKAILRFEYTFSGGMYYKVVAEPL